MAEPTTDFLAAEPAETRQVNARVTAEVYQVLKLLSARHDVSIAKLTEQVMTEFAAKYLADAKEEARAAVTAAQRTAEALERIQLDVSRKLPGSMSSHPLD